MTMTGRYVHVYVYVHIDRTGGLLGRLHVGVGIVLGQM